MNVDKNAKSHVVTYLRHLNLSTDEISAYLYLLQHGSQTVLGLSRGLQTGRTKLYPLLESLTAKQLVVTHERHYGTSYQAADPGTLEHMVSQQEKQAAILRADLSAAVASLELLQPYKPSIEEFSDSKQIFWTTSKSKAPVYVVRSKAVRKMLGAAFLKKYPITATKSIDGTDTEIHIYGNTVSVITTDSGAIMQSKIMASYFTQLYFPHN